MAKRRGRPPGKKYERTVTIQLTEEQWERVDAEAAGLGVSFAETVRANLEVGLNSTDGIPRYSNA